MRTYRLRKTVLAAVLLAVLLLLSGCSAQLEESPPEDLSQVEITYAAEAPVEDAVEPWEERVMLYYLDEEGMTLVPVSRSIIVENGMHPAEAALRALCAGPQEGDAAYWPEAAALNAQRGFELSGGVATVNLTSRMRELTPEILYAVRMAITHTLTEFAGVSYVNVLIGGREEGFDLAATVAMGALSRVEDLDVSARYLRLDEIRQSAQDAGVARLTTLYFPSEDGRWILPEVRNVTYAALQPIEYLYTILEEIGEGPDNPLAMRVPSPMKYIEEMPEIIRTEDGAYRAVEIRFGAEIDTALLDDGLTRGAYLAMLTDALMSFVPGIDGVTAYIAGEQVVSLDAEDTPDGRTMTFAKPLAREDFAGYVGAPGKLYVPAREGGKLTAVDCFFPQGLQLDVRQRLWQLMQQLGGIGALSDELRETDILAVSVEDGCFLLNLSTQFRMAFEQLTAAQERAAVYAIVNTLTEGASVERVAFYFEGKQMETLAGGLEMRGTFVRNPGMVVSD